MNEQLKSEPTTLEMARKFEIKNVFTVETYLYSDLENIAMGVEMEFTENAFRNNDYSTGILNVHGKDSCDCVHAQHPKWFRLRMRTQKTGHINYVDLHVYCEPAVPLKCEIVYGSKQPHKCHKIIKYTNWQYLNTIYFNDDRIVGYKTKIAIVVQDMSSIREITFIPDPEHSLSANLLQLFLDGKYSDLTLLSEEGKTFRVHKAILEKRSEVFRGNFYFDTDKSTIKTSFKEHILQQMLTYIYSDKTPKSSDVTPDLFIAADYYQLLGLKTICAAAFCSQLKVENAVVTLEFAVQHNCKEMVEYAVRFIKRHLDLVSKTYDWRNVNATETLRIFFENGLNK